MNVSIRNKFSNFYIIKNKVDYSFFRKSIDCNICKDIILDPRLCGECENLLCKSCFNTKSSCPSCQSTTIIEVDSQNKRILDLIKLKCKYSCEVSLSDAANHMNKIKHG